MVLYFLGLSIRELLQVRPQSPPPPFGNPPWPCLNPAASHYRQRCVTRLTVRHDGRGRPKGTFSCKCGFVYLRTNTQDEGRYHSVIQFGPIWEAKFQQLWRDHTPLNQIQATLQVYPLRQRQIAASMNLELPVPTRPVPTRIATQLPNLWMNPRVTLKGIGDKLETDLNQIRRFALDLGLPLVRPGNHRTAHYPKFQRALDEADRKQHRTAWLQFLREHENMGRTRLRNHPSGRWLTQHDAEWLNQHLPPISRHRSTADWVARDAWAAREVPRVASELLSASGRPTRVTRGTIMAHIQTSFSIRKNLKQLPFTVTALDASIETDVEFAQRRLIWVAEELHRRGEPVTVGKLRFSIGWLKHTFDTPQVATTIAKLTTT